MDYRRREGLRGLKGLEWLKGILVTLAAGLFFVGSLVLVNTSHLYVSPDETANRYFSEAFARTGFFKGQVDELSRSVGDRIHPRSIVSVDGILLPGSFLGLPFFYGAIVRFTGSWSLWILTPFLTILAAYGWGKVIERFSSKAVGTLSSLFFLLHPAVWYYSARALMHNVLFVDLLILSIFFWVIRPFKRAKNSRGVFNDFLSGFFLGLAFFVRTSEAIWIASALFVTILFFSRSFSLARARAGLLGLLLALALLFGMNWQTYGYPFQTGYTIGNRTVSTIAPDDSIEIISVLPFGFHAKNILTHFWMYGIKLFWWLSALSCVGFVLLFFQAQHRRVMRYYLIMSLAISLWLILLYGSWEIHDNPDPSQITIANSYVRYWLPLYLFSTPMIAAGVLWLLKQIKSRSLKIIASTLLVVLCVSASVYAVFFQGQDGLLASRLGLVQSQSIQRSVLEHTPVNSVVIVDRADKLFFPHRRVIYPLRDETTFDLLPALASQVPVYYYGITLPKQDFDYLNTSRLQKRGLQILFVETYDQESLYKIIQSF